MSGTENSDEKISFFEFMKKCKWLILGSLAISTWGAFLAPGMLGMQFTIILFVLVFLLVFGFAFLLILFGFIDMKFPNDLKHRKLVMIAIGIIFLVGYGFIAYLCFSGPRLSVTLNFLYGSPL